MYRAEGGDGPPSPHSVVQALKHKVSVILTLDVLFQAAYLECTHSCTIVMYMANVGGSLQQISSPAHSSFTRARVSRDARWTTSLSTVSRCGYVK